MSDRLNLNRGAILSSRATRCQYTVSVAPPKKRNENWLVCEFGHDDRRKGGAHPVWVTTHNCGGMQRAGATAGRDADLVAWLLTNRDELIRLARIGQAVEHRADEHDGEEVIRG